MIDTRKFEMIREGNCSYTIPMYELEKNTGLKEISAKQFITFVKGDKDGEHLVQSGIITENLLSMLIQHLSDLNVGDLRNRHTSVAITKLEEAIMWQDWRTNKRKDLSVEGTNVNHE